MTRKRSQVRLLYGPLCCRHEFVTPSVSLMRGWRGSLGRRGLPRRGGLEQTPVGPPPQVGPQPHRGRVVAAHGLMAWVPRSAPDLWDRGTPLESLDLRKAGLVDLCPLSRVSDAVLGTDRGWGFGGWGIEGGRSVSCRGCRPGGSGARPCPPGGRARTRRELPRWRRPGPWPYRVPSPSRWRGPRSRRLCSGRR